MTKTAFFVTKYRVLVTKIDAPGMKFDKIGIKHKYCLTDDKSLVIRLIIANYLNVI